MRHTPGEFFGNVAKKLKFHHFLSLILLVLQLFFLNDPMFFHMFPGFFHHFHGRIAPPPPRLPWHKTPPTGAEKVAPTPTATAARSTSWEHGKGTICGYNKPYDVHGI
jgi:hypothetical protein